MPTSFQAKAGSCFTKNVKLPRRFHLFCKRNAETGRSDGSSRGKNLGHIIIIYPAFTGFPVAAGWFFINLSMFFPAAKPLLHFAKMFLACKMLSKSVSAFAVVSSPAPHDGFSLSRGARFYDWTGATGFRLLPDADMTVPLFSVFLGGAVLFWKLRRHWSSAGLTLRHRGQGLFPRRLSRWLPA